MATPARPVRTVAVIPARGGSKGVPGKNLRTVGGVPLVVRAVRACLAATSVDAVYVSTDDDDIAVAADQAGAQVIVRPAAIAGDEASSEAALLHAVERLAEREQHPDVLVFVQCTSPFIEPTSLDQAVRLVLDGAADSVFSAVATYEFLWRDGEPNGTPGDAEVTGVNHDAAVRPRRQDRRPDFRETGAFYAMDLAGFRRHQHRFFGRTRAVLVDDLTATEIDTAADLLLAEALATVLDGTSPDEASPDELSPDPLRMGLDVDAVITDFDGVHTPDTAYLDENGRESVRVSRSDGLGVARLRAAGVSMLILSKERNPVVTARAHKLGVDVRQGVDDKAPAVRSWLTEHGIDPRRTAYVGNDVNDLEAMAAVGWPVAVRDAHPEVWVAARLRLTRAGGHGAVRELCDLVVAARESAGASVSEPLTPPPTQAPATTGVAVDASPRRASQPA